MIAHDFIWARLKEADLTFEAEQYITDMHYEKVRMCNDGFPDARSPFTNGYSVRLKIAGYRQMYKQAYPHTVHVHNYEKKYLTGYKLGYNQALNDVEPLTKNFVVSGKTVAQHIAGLRKLFNKD